jgi:hypothetical protein
METVTLEKEITLQPGASCIIDITGLPLKNGTGAETQCNWTPDGTTQISVSGTWNYQTGTDGKRTAVIDAHEVRSNPFYLIPIHHMVQRLDAAQTAIIDFSIEASAPTRIETYAANGVLLATDANGDGDFLDAGDFIAADANRNSWPDLPFEDSRPATSLIMYIKPLSKSQGDIELSVKLLKKGTWQTDAIDIVKTSN